MKENNSYFKDEVLNGQADFEFNNNSVIKIKNLFEKDFCNELLSFIEKNEKNIIKKYRNDTKGLVLDKLDSKELIKYFEYPFSYNRNLFGKFAHSKIYKIAESLMKEEIYLFSMEIHSRISMGTIIPPHQDNAFYGLESG